MFCTILTHITIILGVKWEGCIFDLVAIGDFHAIWPLVDGGWSLHDLWPVTMYHTLVRSSSYHPTKFGSKRTFLSNFTFGWPHTCRSCWGLPGSTRGQITKTCSITTKFDRKNLCPWPKCNALMGSKEMWGQLGSTDNNRPNTQGQTSTLYCRVQIPPLPPNVMILIFYLYLPKTTGHISTDAAKITIKYCV